MVLKKHRVALMLWLNGYHDDYEEIPRGDGGCNTPPETYVTYLF
jgi:hypothetical protein